MSDEVVMLTLECVSMEVDFSRLFAQTIFHRFDEWNNGSGLVDNGHEIREKLTGPDLETSQNRFILGKDELGQFVRFMMDTLNNWAYLDWTEPFRSRVIWGKTVLYTDDIELDPEVLSYLNYFETFRLNMKVDALIGASNSQSESISEILAALGQHNEALKMCRKRIQEVNTATAYSQKLYHENGVQHLGTNMKIIQHSLHELGLVLESQGLEIGEKATVN